MAVKADLHILDQQVQALCSLKCFQWSVRREKYNINASPLNYKTMKLLWNFLQQSKQKGWESVSLNDACQEKWKGV